MHNFIFHGNPKKNMFFHDDQLFQKKRFLKKLIFRPSEGYSGRFRCEIRIQRESYA